MQNFKIREKLDQLSGGCGMRTPEKLEDIRTKAMSLTRYIAANATGKDPIKDHADVRTAYCDLLALLTEIDLADELQEHSAYYIYNYTPNTPTNDKED